MADLDCTELKINAPAAKAFRLSGDFIAEQIPKFIAELRKHMNPRPKRLFLDIKRLTKIDKRGMDTLVGLAGFWGDHHDSYLAVVAAPPALQDKLGAQGPFHFFPNFAAGAVRVLDDMMAAMTGQFTALPPTHRETDKIIKVWQGLEDGPVPGSKIVTLGGSFDKITAPNFEKHFKNEVADDIRYLVVRLEDVKSVVEDGLDQLKTASATMVERGGKMVLVNPQPKVRVMMDMLDVTHLFEIAETLDAATASLG
ncbi:MAG: STAS domain-containing protein [Planctomycetota bacterium]|jgi:anti-anti-sigma factor